MNWPVSRTLDGELYGEPWFRSLTSGAGVIAAWQDGFSLILPGLDSCVIEDDEFRPSLIGIANERRARWHEARP
jgi:hypothetical protein